MKLFPHNFGEPHNRAANPPGYLLSDIKRRSLSSLLDRIPRKKSPATRAERQSSVLSKLIRNWKKTITSSFCGLVSHAFWRFPERHCGVLLLGLLHRALHAQSPHVFSGILDTAVQASNREYAKDAY